MKIIQVHNYYQQAGGEDSVVEAERSMLEEHGHEIVSFYKNNEALGASGNKLIAVSQLLKASLQTIWNRRTYREFRKLLRDEKPDVVHCHNTFPLISPSIYWACAKEGIPVVQTLHNYRLLCLNAFLFRNAHAGSNELLAVGQGRTAKNQKPEAKGSICELCVHKSFKWPGIRYRCYRESVAGSAVVALMLFVHKLIGTWENKVTTYIALTDFQKWKMIEGGLPGDKIRVKPNFIDDSSMKEQTAISQQPLAKELQTSNCKPQTAQSYALFVGRLSPEKGCDVLIQAWSQFITSCKPQTTNSKLAAAPQLLIVGDGSERKNLESLASHTTSHLPHPTIHFMGRKPKNEVLSLMRNAQFLVLPSLWYEGFPVTIVEAYALALPVLASNHGSMASVVKHEEHGYLFEPGDATDLADKINWAFDHPVEMKAMGDAACAAFELNYSAEVNYSMLMEIYESVRN